jgi:hypothetical protein
MHWVEMSQLDPVDPGLTVDSSGLAGCEIGPDGAARGVEGANKAGWADEVMARSCDLAMNEWWIPGVSASRRD